MALMVPNVLAVIGFGIIVVLHQLQVRLVEEPYLAQVHGDAYRRYAKRTGRFLPRLSVPAVSGGTPEVRPSTSLAEDRSRPSAAA
jgi:hypothetical protein